MSWLAREVPQKPSIDADARVDADATFQTRILARLDRLPWTQWHWLIVVGLGTVWILDGLEVRIVGAVGGTLVKHGSGISITTAQVGDAAGFYVGGACLGALIFGHLTDRLGRKRLFLVTLGVYLVYRFLEDYLLNPRVMKHTVRISPGLTIVATLIGGALLGIIGALMAIPVAATLHLLYEDVLVPRQDMR
jgi:MFS family permease